MIPVSLRLANFLSYGEDAGELDFTQFRLACLSGPNGHGKSALLDAITWALWGQARKGGGAGKPEAGLLRLGESRMQVEFVFELSGRRYRVVRSYELRKSGTEKRDLQFQYWDRDRKQYQSLTQKRQGDTQRAIIDTLRMDYETFINSSFLLQGRADEFTRKKPRERKEILGEILGLSRYEQLVQLARAHSRECEKSLLQNKARLEGIERDLEQREEVERKFKEVAAQLETLSAQWKSKEEEARDLSGKKEQVERWKIQHAEGRRRLEIQEKELEESKRRSRELRAQLEALRKELEQREAVEARRTRAIELQQRSKALTATLQKHSALDRKRGELLRQWDQERGRLERQRVQLQGKRENLEGKIRELDDFLRRREEIERQAAALEQVKKEVGELERRSEKRSELEKALTEVQRAIEAARSKLEVEKAQLQTQLRQLQTRAQQEPALRKALAEAQKQQERFAALARQLDEMAENGQKLKARREVLETTLKQLRASHEQEREKMALLEQSEEASCPLCQSPLTVSHRDELLGRLSEGLKKLEEDVARQEAELRQVEAALVRQRTEYRRLQEGLAGREKAQEEVGRLQGELAAIASGKEQTDLLAKQLAELEARLTDKRYAEEKRQKERRIEEQLSRIEFSPERLAELRSRQEALSPYAVEKQRLAEAEKTLKKLQEEHAELLQQLESVEESLSKESFGEAIKGSLAQGEAELKALAYDPAELERVEKERAALGDVEEQWARLQASLKRLPEVERESQEAAQTLQKREAACNTLRKELEELKPRLEGWAWVPEALVRVQQEQDALGKERDRLNGELGFLKRERERLERLEQEKLELKRQNAAKSEEKGRLDLLAEALGPKGVQALIIENAVPEIQSEANRILARLSANRTQVAFETVREKKTGGAIETLDIKISDELGTRDYELYSGGEAFRTDLAIRIAVSRLLARRAGTRLRTLVIDEGFGTQDEEGLENIVQVIREIAEEFEKILVVTHLEALKDVFPARIEVTKHPERGSVFEVIHN